MDTLSFPAGMEYQFTVKEVGRVERRPDEFGCRVRLAVQVSMRMQTPVGSLWQPLLTADTECRLRVARGCIANLSVGYPSDVGGDAGVALVEAICHSDNGAALIAAVEEEMGEPITFARPTSPPTSR